MEPSSLPLAVAESIASPLAPLLDKKELIGRLFNSSPVELYRMRSRYDGNWDALVSELLAFESPADSPLTRVFLDMALLHIGHPEGVKSFLSGLKSADRKTFLLVLAQTVDIDTDRLSITGKAGEIPLLAETLCEALEPIVLSLLDAYAQWPGNPENGGLLKRGFEKIVSRFRSSPSLHTRLPVTPEESGEALEWVVNLLCHLAFKVRIPALQALAPIREAGPSGLRIKVIQRFIECGDDETLGIISTYLREPGVHRSRGLDQPGQGCFLHDLSFCVLIAARHGKNEKLRAQAVQLAHDVLVESLAAGDAPERLASTCNGWLYPEWLLEALVPEGMPVSKEVTALLARIARSEFLSLPVRMNALARHHTATGASLPEQEAILKAFIANQEDSWASRKVMEQLEAQGILTHRHLIAAIREPHLCNIAIELFLKRIPQLVSSEKQEAIRFLTEILACWCQTPLLYQYEINDLMKPMAALSPSPEEIPPIREALFVALASAKADAEGRYVAQGIMRHLLAMGGAGEIDLASLEPWDAMMEHWRRKGFSIEQVANLLVEAGAMARPAEVLVPIIFRGGESAKDVLRQLLQDRLVFFSLTDCCYEHHHDQLFAKLAQSLSPPLVLEKVIQMGNVNFNALPKEDLPENVSALGVGVYTTEGSEQTVFIYHNGSAYRFTVYPSGTWMDTWGVLSAFNDFIKQIGRPEAAFWLGSEEEGDEWGDFLCAHRDHFIEVAKTLRLPWRSSPVKKA